MIAAEEAYQRPLGELIVEFLNGGSTITAAADRLGVHRQALYRWMRVYGIRRVARWEMRGGALEVLTDA